MKKEKLKRVAEISSKFMLVNDTSLKLSSLILDESNLYEEKELKTGTSTPVPFNLIDKSAMLSLKSSMSQKFNLGTFKNEKQKKVYSLSLACAKESYNKLMLEVVPVGSRVFINVRPALKVFNYCPTHVEYTVRSNRFEESNMIFRSDPLEVYQFDPFEEKCRLALTFMDVYKQEIDLRDFVTGKKNKEKLKFESLKKNDDSYIYIDIVNDFENRSMYIYSKFNIFNETGLKFDMLSDSVNSFSGGKKMIPTSDPTILFEPSKKNDTLLIILNDKTLQSLPGVEPFEKNSHRCVFPKNINYNINTGIKSRGNTSNPKGWFDLNFNITPSKVTLSERLNIHTKILTITPKCVFINNTPFKMNLIQEGFPSQWSIDASKRIPLWWRSQTKKCSFQIEHPDAQL